MPKVKPTIGYSSLPDVTPEKELLALTNVYRFILDRHANKNAVGTTSTDSDNGKGSIHEVCAKAAGVPR